MEAKEGASIEILNYLKSIVMGNLDIYENMAVLQIRSENTDDDNYLLLEDALKTGHFKIEETSESGNVPELKVINATGADVLILEGQELRGAKQNRTVNTSLIIGKDKTVIIPVSCVERGRWHYRGRSFDSGDFVYCSLRREKSQSVTNSLKRRRSYASNQGAVWDNIRLKSNAFNVRSDTENMSDIFEQTKFSIKAYQNAFKPYREQTGFMVFINNRIVGIDAFGPKGMLPKVYDRLLKGYILDALERRTAETAKVTDKEIINEQAMTFIMQLMSSNMTTFKSIGEGFDVRIESSRANGFGLVNRAFLVHLAVFND